MRLLHEALRAILQASLFDRLQEGDWLLLAVMPVRLAPLTCPREAGNR